MKTSYLTLALLFALATANVSGQSRLSAYIESRQGHHPAGADIIGHAKVSKGDVLRCSMVEVYDASHESSTACVIRFGSGPKNTLALNESISAPEDSTGYLECAGDKPRRCAVKVTTESTASSHPPN